MITLRGRDIRMPEPCVLAVGKFESIHLGHRALIGEVVRLAKDNGLASALIVFEPHPYRVLSDSGYKPLFTGPERARLVEGLGVDYMVEHHFDADFAALSGCFFGQKLINELQARIVVVGKGYRFGRGREGTVDTLRLFADVVEVGVNETSTSAIRGLLSENKLTEAEGLLGFPFFIIGDVTPGQRLGRTIGFPTINLYPCEEKYLPVDGVYATRVVIDNKKYRGVTNIGVRPTVADKGAPRSVETYLLDFEGGELYGKDIRVEFLSFIRLERRFDSLEALQVQIAKDCKKVAEL
ncbi:MAG: riboflavin biosynthesis protein RibF [Defluviitaleaceae bacterium]|nr:riboflavin biosynthesis protein RibF [Defluviitaleaceae bacterium]